MSKYDNLVKTKVEELTGKINSMKTNEQVSKNTRSNMLYHLGRDRKILYLIQELLGGKELSKDAADTLISITTLTSERNRSVVEVKKGDKIMDLLDKYKNVKDIYKKIQSFCEKNGLTMDFAKGIINIRSEAYYGNN